MLTAKQRKKCGHPIEKLLSNKNLKFPPCMEFLRETGIYQENCLSCNTEALQKEGGAHKFIPLLDIPQVGRDQLKAFVNLTLAGTGFFKNKINAHPSFLPERPFDFHESRPQLAKVNLCAP